MARGCWAGSRRTRVPRSPASAAAAPLTAAELAAALGWVAARGEEALDALALHRLVRANEGRYHPLLAG